MALQIAQRDTGPVTILDLTGKLAGEASVTLADTIENLVKAGRNKLILNLAGVPFIDSGALGGLVSQRSFVIGEGGQLKLLNLSERISDVMVTTRLVMVFDMFSSESDAIQSFS